MRGAVGGGGGPTSSSSSQKLSEDLLGVSDLNIHRLVLEHGGIAPPPAAGGTSRSTPPAAAAGSRSGGVGLTVPEGDEVDDTTRTTSYLSATTSDVWARVALWLDVRTLGAFLQVVRLDPTQEQQVWQHAAYTLHLCVPVVNSCTSLQTSHFLYPDHDEFGHDCKRNIILSHTAGSCGPIFWKHLVRNFVRHQRTPTNVLRADGLDLYVCGDPNEVVDRPIRPGTSYGLPFSGQCLSTGTTLAPRLMLDHPQWPRVRPGEGLVVLRYRKFDESATGEWGVGGLASGCGAVSCSVEPFSVHRGISDAGQLFTESLYYFPIGYHRSLASLVHKVGEICSVSRMRGFEADLRAPLRSLFWCAVEELTLEVKPTTSSGTKIPSGQAGAATSSSSTSSRRPSISSPATRPPGGAGGVLLFEQEDAGACGQHVLLPPIAQLTRAARPRPASGHSFLSSSSAPPATMASAASTDGRTSNSKMQMAPRSVLENAFWWDAENDRQCFWTADLLYSPKHSRVTTAACGDDDHVAPVVLGNQLIHAATTRDWNHEGGGSGDLDLALVVQDGDDHVEERPRSDDASEFDEDNGYSSYATGASSSTSEIRSTTSPRGVLVSDNKKDALIEKKQEQGASASSASSSSSSSGAQPPGSEPAEGTTSSHTGTEVLAESSATSSGGASLTLALVEQHRAALHQSQMQTSSTSQSSRERIGIGQHDDEGGGCVSVPPFSPLSFDAEDLRQELEQDDANDNEDSLSLSGVSSIARASPLEQLNADAESLAIMDHEALLSHSLVALDPTTAPSRSSGSGGLPFVPAAGTESIFNARGPSSPDRRNLFLPQRRTSEAGTDEAACAFAIQGEQRSALDELPNSCAFSFERPPRRESGGVSALASSSSSSSQSSATWSASSSHASPRIITAGAAGATASGGGDRQMGTERVAAATIVPSRAPPAPLPTEPVANASMSINSRVLLDGRPEDDRVAAGERDVQEAAAGGSASSSSLTPAAARPLTLSGRHAATLASLLRDAPHLAPHLSAIGEEDLSRLLQMVERRTAGEQGNSPDDDDEENDTDPYGRGRNPFGGEDHSSESSLEEEIANRKVTYTTSVGSRSSTTVPASSASASTALSPGGSMLSSVSAAAPSLSSGAFRQQNLSSQDFSRTSISSSVSRGAARGGSPGVSPHLRAGQPAATSSATPASPALQLSRSAGDIAGLMLAAAGAPATTTTSSRGTGPQAKRYRRVAYDWTPRNIESVARTRLVSSGSSLPPGVYHYSSPPPGARDVGVDAEQENALAGGEGEEEEDEDEDFRIFSGRRSVRTEQRHLQEQAEQAQPGRDNDTNNYSADRESSRDQHVVPSETESPPPSPVQRSRRGGLRGAADQDFETSTSRPRPRIGAAVAVEEEACPDSPSTAPKKCSSASAFPRVLQATKQARQFEFAPFAPDRLMLVGDKHGSASVVDIVEDRKVGNSVFIDANPLLGLSWLSLFPNRALIGAAHSGSVIQRDNDNHLQKLHLYQPFHQLSSLSANATNDYFVASGFAHDIGVFDVNRNFPIKNILGAHEHFINISRFAHTHPHLVATASFDGTCKLWDLRNQKTNRPCCTWHTGGLNVMCAFSPDDRFLLASGVDTRVLQYEISQPDRTPNRFAGLLPKPRHMTRYRRSVYFANSKCFVTGATDEGHVHVVGVNGENYGKIPITCARISERFFPTQLLPSAHPRTRISNSVVREAMDENDWRDTSSSSSPNSILNTAFIAPTPTSEVDGGGIHEDEAPIDRETSASSPGASGSASYQRALLSIGREQRYENPDQDHEDDDLVAPPAHAGAGTTLTTSENVDPRMRQRAAALLRQSPTYRAASSPAPPQRLASNWTTSSSDAENTHQINSSPLDVSQRTTPRWQSGTTAGLRIRSPSGQPPGGGHDRQEEQAAHPLNQTATEQAADPYVQSVRTHPVRSNIFAVLLAGHPPRADSYIALCERPVYKNNK